MRMMVSDFDYDVILMVQLVHSSSKVSIKTQHLPLFQSVQYRLLKVVPIDLPTLVSYPHFIYCLASS